MAGPFRITQINPQFLAENPNVQLPNKNIAAASMYERGDKDREYNRQMTADNFQRQKYQEEREIKAMDAMLKDPRNAEMIARSYGVQMTPQIHEMLQNPKVAQQMTDALKLAKDSGLDRYESIQEFVTGYMQSGGDAIKAMESVTDKQSLKELYYNQRLTGRGGNTVKAPAGYTYVPDPSGGIGNYQKIPGLDESFYRKGKPDTFSGFMNDEDTTAPQQSDSSNSRLPMPAELIDAIAAKKSTANPVSRPPLPPVQRITNPEDPFDYSKYPILNE